MYEEFIGKKVLVVVTTKSDRVMEYNGILNSEDEKCIRLNDVSISMQLTNMQSSIFGRQPTSFYDNSMPSAIINKEYITDISIYSILG